ncbi:5-carboxymethyl-2-hydroxymuconate Delta-isomerase [uncultured Ralstonia sp.]|jgi:5-carboxymethyl-2-hydroxymuconate isomerase|uniref:5-carboxymethyl-2-hydroxymuconate Delta-isomerase n=1 Tax=Ralstonia sp. TaxID=54061 RepID=UPI0025ED83D0|nr:5-carboxymethyl-2-hydroxymuconate Delta-isomerase [uncultured Ralstonia sp.]
MPHVIVEYTDNLGDDARIPQLLETINATLIAQNGVFPTGGIRSRAIKLTEYRVADGKEDDAFVHVTMKIGAGRSAEVKKAACDALFEAIKVHFADAFAKRYLALSMELTEFDEGGSYKHNNIHARFRKA